MTLIIIQGTPLGPKCLNLWRTLSVVSPRALNQTACQQSRPLHCVASNLKSFTTLDQCPSSKPSALSPVPRYCLHRMSGTGREFSLLHHHGNSSGSISTDSRLSSSSGGDILQPALVSWSVCRTYAKKKGKERGAKVHKHMSLTEEQLEGIVDMERVKGEIAHALDELKDKFIHQLTVRTSQGVFDQLQVKTPDGVYPLIQLGQIQQKSPQLIAIHLAASPQYIVQVKEALSGSGLNVNPQQDGTSLFLNLPPVTREHRETLAKNAKALGEKSKKHLRDIYSSHSRKIKASKDGHSSDILVAADDMVQSVMHTAIQQVEEMTALKQKELVGK